MGEQNLPGKLKEVLLELEILEKNYRKIYNSAVDIEDFEISQKTQSDAYLKIRKLKDWKNIVADLNDNVSDSNIIEIVPLVEINNEVPKETEGINEITDKDVNNNELHNKNEKINEKLTERKIVDHLSEKNEIIDIATTQEPFEFVSEEQILVGKFVRSKMYELIDMGFIFSDNDIDIMQKKPWAKEILGLNYEFIKVTYLKHGINDSVKTLLGYDRYWKEIFTFGKYKIVVTNQIFEKDLERFNHWYIKLDKSKYILKQDLEEAKKISKNESKGYNHKEPVNIKLFDKQYPIKCWNEVLLKVCEIMLLKKPYTVATFGRIPTLNNKTRTNFSYTESDIKFDKKRLSNGLWIEVNRSPDEIYMACKTILELCEFSEIDLTIDFK